jgi:hypothetical protein
LRSADTNIRASEIEIERREREREKEKEVRIGQTYGAAATLLFLPNCSFTAFDTAAARVLPNSSFKSESTAAPREEKEKSERKHRE